MTLFAQFVKENPDSPLAPNAFYWMGESYMSGKNYEKAIVQFQEVVDKYPKSDKAGKAMLRQADAFSALGDKKSSTTLLKRVIELFPKSEEARLAEEKTTWWRSPLGTPGVGSSSASALSRATIS